jgi:hypothetical protein
MRFKKLISGGVIVIDGMKTGMMSFTFCGGSKIYP